MKYIALDIGNVCLHIDPPGGMRRMGVPPVPPREMLALALAFECGRITMQEFAAGARRILPQITADDAELLAQFNSILLEPMAGMSDAVAHLIACGVQPVFFSDISAAHLAATRKKLPLAQMVPCGVFSCEVGATKPSPQMFRAFEARFGRPLLYVDDRADLIAAARRYGWAAWQFTDAAAFEREVGNALALSR